MAKHEIIPFCVSRTRRVRAAVAGGRRLLAAALFAGLLGASLTLAGEGASSEGSETRAAAAAASAEPVPPGASTTVQAGAPRPRAARPPAVAAPRITGRLTAADLGLVINTADPYSVDIGEYYIAARKLSESQVLRVELPRRAELTPEEFQQLEGQVNRHFGPEIQALALAWKEPFLVGCNSITGALTMGYDAALCEQTCAPSRKSSYFNSATIRPFTDLKMRPSMLLAANDIYQAEAMVKRGVASDHTLGLRGSPPVNAHYLITRDKARSSRAVLFPPPGLVRGVGIDVHVDNAEALDGAERLLLYQTGQQQVDKLDTLSWVPGGIGDHLTSYGGRIDGKRGQMSALAWIASGATATYGTVSEPCSHPQKFPHPQLVLLHYAQGASVIEAYWKSVAWPQQGLFIGEPLAAPFSRR